MKIIQPTVTPPEPRLTAPQPARIVPFGAPPPDAADEDFADGSVEMNGDGSQFRVALALQAAQPLVSDRTVYVNSATGSDTNTGAQAAPFQTFARAWDERKKYGVLRARFTIQLLGVGPYALPTMLGVSLADVGGYLIIRGDETAEVTHYSGTFTGDFGTGTSGCTIGTSAGLGADTHRGRFVKITSGPAAGCVFMILQNTDTSITACSRTFKGAGSFTITAGTTFRVFTPGTQLSGSPRCECWFGGDLLPVQSELRHVFLNVAVTGGISLRGCGVVFLACTMTANAVWYQSNVSTHFIDATVLGAASPHAYRSAGLSTSSTLTVGQRSSFYGAFFSTGTTNVSTGASFDHSGGRLAALTVTAQYNVTVAGAANESAFRFTSTVTVRTSGIMTISGTNPISFALCEWAVTSGSCIRVQRGGLVDCLLHLNDLSGGTTDAAGYGIDCSGGGACFVQKTPTLTGGTAGKDLKTTNNGAVANATLSAAGTAAGVAADALLGEVLARVA